MAKLKPWYHVVTPREDLRENRALDASEFAVHLDHIRTGRALPDYANPARFFDRTFMTKALLELSSQAVRRLSGIKLETSAVFNMATQFGGGKTHSLTALYHLANGGETAKAWKGVEQILSKAGVKSVPHAKIAVFVGNEFDGLSGRGGSGEPLRKTPWGEVAWQLSGADGFAAVAEHDARGIAPGGDVIRKMLPNEPTLILMDELLNYVSRGRKASLGSGLFDFLQNLSEEARARDNLVLCVSIPASELEMNPEDQRDHDSIKKLLDRVGKAIMMSAETEAAEIIRRRLFEWGGLHEDGKKAALEYADWAIEHAAELSGVDASNARELFTTAYPFHPAVLSVFERKWQSLPRFQRTRGILRLLALWVQYAHQEDHRRAGGRGDALITLGSAPIENPTFRAAMFEQLGSSELEISVTTDIAGKSDAWAMRLDREASDAIKKERLHQKTATSILFESNGGQTKQLFASVSDIRTAVAGPDVIMTDIELVLEQLVSSCYYLSQNGNQYKFGLTPNLNKILTDRRAGVPTPAIEQRVAKEIETVFRLGPKQTEIERIFAPRETNQVSDRAILTLVVMGLDTPAGSPATRSWMESIVRECGTSGRSMKSALIFVAPESPSSIIAATRDVLAWEDIEDDADIAKRIDETQRKQLIGALGRARSDLRESIWRAYRHLFLLDKSNTLKATDLGQITSSSAKSIVDLILNRLVEDAEITEGVGPNKLLKFWPASNAKWSTKAVREAFYASPLLPRLRNPDVIRRTIVDGVAQRQFGLARDDGRGGLILERDIPTEATLEIADDVYILKAEDAKKLLEPPRLTKIVISPGSVSIRPGERATFSVEGFDQYGQPITTDAVSWESTGGEMDAQGSYTAGMQPGAYLVRARCDAVVGTASVRLAAIEEAFGGGAGSPERDERAVLRWSGTIPPQKWMNFYTRIVSKYVSRPEMRLTINFEVPLDGSDLPSRQQEMNTALDEMGIPRSPLSGTTSE